ncbi:hypothetical protein OC834_005542, partial [Tilletia horrida]
MGSAEAGTTSVRTSVLRLLLSSSQARSGQQEKYNDACLAIWDTVFRLPEVAQDPAPPAPAAAAPTADIAEAGAAPAAHDGTPPAPVAPDQAPPAPAADFVEAGAPPAAAHDGTPPAPAADIVKAGAPPASAHDGTPPAPAADIVKAGAPPASAHDGTPPAPAADIVKAGAAPAAAHDGTAPAPAADIVEAGAAPAAAHDGTAPAPAADIVKAGAPPAAAHDGTAPASAADIVEAGAPPAAAHDGTAPAPAADIVEAGAAPGAAHDGTSPAPGAEGLITPSTEHSSAFWGTPMNGSAAAFWASLAHTSSSSPVTPQNAKSYFNTSPPSTIVTRQPLGPSRQQNEEHHLFTPHVLDFGSGFGGISLSPIGEASLDSTGSYMQPMSAPTMHAMDLGHRGGHSHAQGSFFGRQPERGDADATGHVLQHPVSSDLTEVVPEAAEKFMSIVKVLQQHENGILTESLVKITNQCFLADPSGSTAAEKKWREDCEGKLTIDFIIQEITP